MIYIRALEIDDYKTTHEWRLHEKTWDSVIGPKRYISTETERKWVENSIRLHEEGELYRFAICEENVNTLMGIIGITNIDNHNKSFSMSSMIAPDLRGRGVIAMGRKLVLRYMFDEIGMERVWVRILEDNLPSRKSVEKFGYVKEGVMRKAAYKNSVFKNLVVYSMLKDEFHMAYGKTEGVN